MDSIDKQTLWNRILINGLIVLFLFGAVYFLLGSAIYNAVVFFGLLAGTCFLFGLFCLLQKRHARRQEKTPFTEVTEIVIRYRFLLQQLVSRDFSVKYRRSYLGFLWTILHPLLTMIVMSAVFSFIFRSNIENYPVYLIVGQVTFSFFSESTQAATVSISGSGQLMKKVYMPKYIFPISKILFSFINFLLSLIPVALVMLYYRIPLTVNVLFLPFFLTVLLMFSTGMGCLLAALQPHFRDTTYLYGITLTIWTYLTPIFYPVSALSPALQRIMILNPMYDIIDGVRLVTIYGGVPTLRLLGGCMAVGILSLWVGITYFKRHQERFILYI